MAGIAGVGLAKPIFVDFLGGARNAFAAEDIRLTLDDLGLADKVEIHDS
jgi:hypothetical protein